MSPPDYVILGAMKCGTSTLAAQLGEQEGIFMTTPKEPGYFSHDEVFAKGPDWYAALFEAAAPGDLRGEASTHYAKLPDLPRAAERLSAAAPGAKLIYLIRDPVARALSHLVHEWSFGKMELDADAALDRHPELIEYGLYGRQMEPWVEAMGAEAIHVDTLEAMHADPQALMDRVGRFLGREDLVWRAGESERLNASSGRLRRRPLDGLLVHSAPATWLRRRFVPQSLRDRIKARRRPPVRPRFSAASLARLEAVFAEDRVRLHALFPGRADLDAAYPFARP